MAIALLSFQGASTVVAMPHECVFPGEGDSIVVFQPGESVHSYKPSRCQDSESFPCICNPDAPGQIECPFCWISIESENVLCIDDGDSLTYTNPKGEEQTCGCTLSTIEFNAFSTDCHPSTKSTTRSETIENEFGLAAAEEDLNIFSDGDKCTIDGVAYFRGQKLGFSHDSGCSGSSFDYQCYCNPDKPDQIDCPYCYFDVQGSDDPICLRDGEIVTFDDMMGNARTCGCSVPENGTPQPNCFLAPDSANACAIEVPDGSVQVFAAGASLFREIPSRCGPNYPCFCEPTVVGQIWCPYCTYAESQQSVLCAGDGETISYVDMDQNSQTCSCQVSSDPSEEPVSTCSGDPTKGETSPGTNADEDAETDDLQTDPMFGVCELNGNLFFAGENVGDNFVTRCGDVTDFPCFCNPDRDPPVDCPYCGFALTKENLLCLKNEQVANFVDIYGDDRTCECIAPTTSSSPTENCLLSSLDVNVCVFRDENGDPVTYDAGEPVDDSLIPLSNCGASFQCFCDPQASDQLSCPFCAEVDFGGQLICASDGESVVYQDENGAEQSCFCEVPSDLSTQKPSINCVDTPPARPPTVDVTTPTPTSPNTTVTEFSCVVLSPQGEEVVALDGEAFGPELGDGVCGSSVEWPKICNAAGVTEDAQITYPYCRFENTAFGTVACARDDDSVRFMDSSQKEVVCSCNLGEQPETACKDAVTEDTGTKDAAVNLFRWSGSALMFAALFMGALYEFI